MANHRIIGRGTGALLLLCALAACAPYRGFYRDGAPVARLNTDLTACRVRGVNEVPANTQIRSTPPTVLPGRRICNAKGTVCRYTGSRIIPGEVYSYDANAGLRNRLVSQCMAGRGYAEVEIPLCPAGAREQVLARSPTTLPPLGPATCAVRGDGGYVFAQTAPG